MCEKRNETDEKADDLSVKIDHYHHQQQLAFKSLDSVDRFVCNLTYPEASLMGDLCSYFLLAATS